MKPEPNFFLVNRALLEHSWLTKNRHLQLAWIYIIGRANFETGLVNLTEVYRELSDMLENYQWRRFVKRCATEGMLTNLTRVNLGDQIGFQQTAIVANYSKYQGEKSSRKVPERLPERVPERLPERYDVQDANNEDAAGANAGALPERLPESNKELNSKELKEVKPLSSKTHDDAYETFKALWNKQKPERSATLLDNKEVRKHLKPELKRLGLEELLRRAAAALVFVRADRFHTETRPCTPVTLLRHLDTYAEQGQASAKTAPQAEKPHIPTTEEVMREAMGDSYDDYVRQRR